MRRAWALIGTLLAAALLVPVSPGVAVTLTGRVTAVVDGDTIKVQARGFEDTVRLLGIDTPETKKPGTPVQCFGLEARARMQRLLPTGRQVRLVTDPTQCHPGPLCTAAARRLRFVSTPRRLYDAFLRKGRRREQETVSATASQTGVAIARGSGSSMCFPIYDVAAERDYRNGCFGEPGTFQPLDGAEIQPTERTTLRGGRRQGR